MLSWEGTMAIAIMDARSFLPQLILSHVEAKQIILFGSYAQKTMKSDSDIDILILVDDSVSNLRESIQLLYREVSAVKVPLTRIEYALISKKQVYLLGYL